MDYRSKNYCLIMHKKPSCKDKLDEVVAIERRSQKQEK
jgi:hypothetical protein